MIVLMAGLPGTGKSTLARELAARTSGRVLSKDEIRWMEHYLFYMKALGLVEPEEERHQWVFHIMVSGLYADWRETQNIVPVAHPDEQRPDSDKPETQVALGSGTK